MENDNNMFIIEYEMFDPNTLTTSIIMINITTAQFEFKPMMFQMLQTICQFSGAVTDDPRMRLKQFTKVAKNSKS
ncbi:hypothetical protein MTR_4g078865 [Medicago truncatula]|uniref:Uncharacterized protein n=1 Tax=Medicago truncatula TaxID=3880 RepID=A0A072ULQ4_MEDTR|nr:hypothetical protein MTR_4g078865 [Medicago truncatula]